MKILFLDLDSVNPEHLSCYGYHRQTSPNIDKIAKQGVLFTKLLYFRCALRAIQNSMDDRQIRDQQRAGRAWRDGRRSEKSRGGS
jgi:hypothetical protein